MAHVLVGLTVEGREDKEQLLARIKETDFSCTDLSDDDIVKEHLRHMIGGKAAEAVDQIFSRIEFPELSYAPADFFEDSGRSMEHLPLPLPQCRQRLRKCPYRL